MLRKLMGRKKWFGTFESNPDREETWVARTYKASEANLFQITPEPLEYAKAIELMRWLREMEIKYDLVCPKGYDNDPKKEGELANEPNA